MAIRVGDTYIHVAIEALVRCIVYSVAAGPVSRPSTNRASAWDLS